MKPIDRRPSFSLEEARLMTQDQRSYRRRLGMIVPIVRDGTHWTWEKVAKFKDLLAQRLSGAQIAAQMGITRSAVMGKAKRLGLKVGGGFKPAPFDKRSGPQGVQARRQSAQERRRKARGALLMPPTPKGDRPSSEPYRPAQGDAARSFADKPIGIMELTGTTCRWPVSEFKTAAEAAKMLFCGEKTVTVYCERHAIIAVPQP